MSVVDLKEKFGEPKVWQTVISNYILSVITITGTIIIAPLLPKDKPYFLAAIATMLLIVFLMWASTLTYTIWAVAITPASASPIPIFLTLIMPIPVAITVWLIFLFTGSAINFFDLFPHLTNPSSI